ncbi:MAG: HD domain-containing protein [Acidobacteriota bacterium]|nr:HD domain-containing protein [Acidobacteriota bacterium]
MPQPAGSRLPLFLVLLGMALVISLVPVGVFGLLTVRGSREALVVSQQEQQLLLAASTAERLDAFLDHVGREAVKLGEAFGVLRAQAGGRLDFLPEFLDETVVLMRYRPVEGRSSTAVVPELVLSHQLEESLDRDARVILEHGAAPTPASARGAVLGGPYSLGPERILAITVSAPVQRRGRLMGVLQEVAVLQGVWNDLASSVPASMRLFLVRPDGKLVARTGSGGGPTPRQLLDRAIVQEFLGMRGRSRGAQAYKARGPGGEVRQYLGSYSATEYGWGVFVEVDEALALAPVSRLVKDVIFGGVLAAGLAIVAALLMGGVISRPMARLAAISSRLAAGDFSVRAGASRVREIDALASNFNFMAAKLGDLVERFRAAARDANAMFLGTIRALAEAIDEKDPYTKGHSVRVNRYAVIIGRYLGLSREEMKALHVSALLHDVGKIGIDDSILKKPAALTAAEFEVMKSHPERGAKIMGRIPQMKSIIPGMRFHHERWNGSGYPLGLKDQEIPLQARIVAVADTFDAMTTDRPYQKAFSEADAVARINDLKGVGLDPEVVEAFNRAYEAGEFDEVFRTRPNYFQSEDATDEAESAPTGPERAAAASSAGSPSREQDQQPAEAKPHLEKTLST